MFTECFFKQIIHFLSSQKYAPSNSTLFKKKNNYEGVQPLTVSPLPYRPPIGVVSPNENSIEFFRSYSHFHSTSSIEAIMVISTKGRESEHKRSPNGGWKTWKHLSDYGFPSLYLAVVYSPTFHFIPEDKLILQPVTMEPYGSRFTLKYIPANMKSKQMDYFPSSAPRDSWMSCFTFNFEHWGCFYQRFVVNFWNFQVG